MYVKKFPGGTFPSRLGTASSIASCEPGQTLPIFKSKGWQVWKYPAGGGGMSDPP